MQTTKKELQEMLEIGQYLGSGPRYLLDYHGQLAITNDTGLIHWPEGPKRIIAIIKAHEFKGGLNLAKKSQLLIKLNSYRDMRVKRTLQTI